MKKFLLLIFTIFIHCSLFATTKYVNVNVVGGANDGSSWANAYTDLQDAIDAAMTAGAGTEVWVAAGTYLPTDAPDGTTSTGATDRNNAFHFDIDIKIYGGFSGNGTETMLSQRDAATNVTILSSDLGIVNDNADNAYHVFITASLTNAAIIDGFTIKDGKADGSGTITYSGQDFIRSYGGGMYNRSSSPTLTNITFSSNSANNGGGMYNFSSSPTLTNITFSSNSANYGGGMYNSSVSPTLTNITFSNNSANRGGGMYNAASSPTLTNITFSSNSADYGGGMFNLTSSPTLTNITFSSNSTTNNGGGMYNRSSSSPALTNITFSSNSATSFGGGMYNTSFSSPTLTNITFSSNSAGSGGGMYNRTSSSPTLTNVTFSSNSAGSGGGMYNRTSSSPTLYNTVFYGNTKNGAANDIDVDATTSNIHTFSSNNASDGTGGNIGTGTGFVTLTTDPFTNSSAPNGADNIWRTADDGLIPSSGSPLLGAGTATGAPTNDIAGTARPNPPSIGAYEVFTALPVELIYFTGKNTKNGNLLTWQTASEKNNEGFEIQKSKDGIEWETLDFVQGNGTTLEISNYEYLDENPFGNINYYRLKQIDFDGKFDYSNIVIIESRASNSEAVEPRIYPNPVSDILNIENGQGQAVIYNMLGQPIRAFSIVNRREIGTGSQLSISVSDLPKGQYLLHIQQENGNIITKKFVK